MKKSLDINAVLALSGIEEKRKTSLFTEGGYSYFGNPVPRVSNLLKWCFNKEHLINWASKITKEEYDMFTKSATTVGTLAHEQIENYLNGEEVIFDHIEIDSYRKLVRTAVENFVAWHNYFKSQHFYIRPLYIEERIATFWYGGTIDCIAEITFPNGYKENVIIDFKTSKSIGTEYIMQTFAYMWGVNWLRDNGRYTLPKVSGIMIVRVDKYKKDNYQITFLDENNNMQTFKELEVDLSNMVNWFYSQINLMDILKVAKATGKRIMEVDYNGREDSNANSDGD